MAPVPSVGGDASSVPSDAGNHGCPHQTKGTDIDSFNEFCGLRRYFYHILSVCSSINTIVLELSIFN